MPKIVSEMQTSITALFFVCIATVLPSLSGADESDGNPKKELALCKEDKEELKRRLDRALTKISELQSQLDESQEKLDRCNDGLTHYPTSNSSGTFPGLTHRLIDSLNKEQLRRLFETLNKEQLELILKTFQEQEIKKP
jgi:division protein CdvB (Snf7/Vps24/ESCRT-III family)